MFQALAPRMPRGISWVWLAIAVVAWAPLSAIAQNPPTPPGDKPAAKDDKPAAKDDKPAAKDDDDDEGTEAFLDPNAKRTLAIFGPLNYTGIPIKWGTPPDDRSKVQRMASRIENIDRDFLKRFVEYFAVELTKRENLNAVLNPPANQKASDAPSRALERSVDALIKPMIDARANDNKEFLTEYTRILFDSPLPRILENNYLSRIDAMIVLGYAGGTSNSQLDLYIKEIKKPEQVIWVKLWAARGLSNAAMNGKVDLDASKSIQGADALIGFLDSDPKLPWPAQMRALEALGSLRVASATTPKGKIDAASVAMRYLADPSAKPEVRAWAAWALGMMKVPAAVSPFNFSLVGQEVGELAVSLGDKIVKEFDQDPANFEREKDYAQHLTGLLLFQVCPSLIGQENTRDSGLLNSTHPSAGLARPALTKIDDKVKAVAREALELLKAGGVGVKAKRNDLDAKLADLKAFLGQAVPKDRHLTPGGPEFPPNGGEQVAGAAGP